MKYNLLLVALLSATVLFGVETIQESQLETMQPITAEQPYTGEEQYESDNNQASRTQVIEPILSQEQNMLITVIGQGVAPMNTASPAQAYALAKRAAIADAYRMIAEKVKGVRVDGQDLIKNMMVKRSVVRTSVRAMVRNANVTETTFKDGLCEVEMEITLSHADFAQ